MIRERRPKQINPAVVATGYIRAEPGRSHPHNHSPEKNKNNQKEKECDGGGSGTLRPCPESYKVAGSNPAPASADTQEYEEAETCGCDGKGLRKTLREFTAHYHEERNHQGLGNNIIEPGSEVGRTEGEIRRRLESSPFRSQHNDKRATYRDTQASGTFPRGEVVHDCFHSGMFVSQGQNGRFSLSQSPFED